VCALGVLVAVIEAVYPKADGPRLAFLVSKRLGQRPLSRAGETHPLAPEQLRVGESGRGAAATADGSLADRCVNKVQGSLTAGDTHERRSRTSGFPAECPA
jgi:hypothetical protein